MNEASTSISWRMGLARCVACALLLYGQDSFAQNRYSFGDAARSVVPYTQTPYSSTASCESFLSLTRPDIAVLSARVIAAQGKVPGHCRVSGVIPAEIVFEVNLPLAWNGRLQMHGNGAFGGQSPADTGSAFNRDQALAQGFATAFTNTGHDLQDEPGASFGYNNLQKTVDYSFRAVHLTVQAAKDLVARFYGRGPNRSYWNGCSTGGRQGLMSAQRFPEDFDGIVAGSPPLDFTGSMLSFVWNSKVQRQTPIRPDTEDLLAKAIYARCDALDGLQDGLIEDPRRCDFDPAVHLSRCSAAQAQGNCVSAKEVDALQKIYAGPSEGGKSLYPGQVLGAEVVGTSMASLDGSSPRVRGWEPWLVNPAGPSGQQGMAESFLKYLAFEHDDPKYDWTTFDFAKDPPRMRAIADMLNATNPDLSRFRARGGKMIGYFGWADAVLNPLRMVQYYEQVGSASGGPPQDFYRLFMVPGMFHCSGGIGTDQIDAITAVVEWVEAGKPPDRIVSYRKEKGALQFSRSLCPYPQLARYKGSGSKQAAESFECTLPAK